MWLIFLAVNKGSTLENIDQSQRRGILGRVSISISELVSHFQEANKKGVIVMHNENFLEDLDNHESIHKKSAG
jgi:hypothetical protein